MKIIVAWKKLAAILADKKVSPDERAAFLEALAELIAAVFETIAPYVALRSGPTQIANRTVSNLKLCAADLKRSA